MTETNNKEVIDMVEKTLTTEELTKDYVDIKQASQILNNVSTKTAKKYIDEVSESHGIRMEVVTVTSNGGLKKLYRKEMIVNIAKILNKDKTVLVHVPVDVSEGSFQENDASNGSSNSSSNSLPIHSNSFQEVQTGEGGQKLAIAESLRGISELRTNFKEFSGNLRELNDNVRQVNLTMQTTISKIVEQGIDLKERYLKDREERTAIERQQTESLSKQSEAFAKQSEALIELTKKIEQQKPQRGTNANFSLIAFLILAAVLGAGWAGFYFFTLNQQKMEYQFEERLSQERQIQQDQFQLTIKQLKESLAPAVTNAVLPPAGQGKK